MNHDAAKTALDSLQAGEDYYSAECPRCRRLNKITIKQLKRSLPRQDQPSDDPATKE